VKTEPSAVLALVYWVHMLATVVWIGSLAGLIFLVIPIARKVLDTGAQVELLGLAQARLQNLGWFSLGLLAVTGLFQMSANPNYRGFLQISNLWSVAILAKHLTIALMLVLNTYLTFWLTPARQRAAFRQKKGLDTSQLSATLLKREQLLLAVTLGLSGLVLGLTALARAS